ncbi:FAD-binding oxidoreductase [Candidatus Poriferisodalis sp.]|uniref:FAD-binding oxidoreductase n=1 Tax=Candidatus Poriferisodalis sp. TaxID=3101277 RepID=UPI003B01A67A
MSSQPSSAGSPPAAATSGSADAGASLAANIAAEVTAFAGEVGISDPVTVVGAQTHWDAGGAPLAGTRKVRAPAGVWEHEPSEMTVRCGAGTTVAELATHLARTGQMVPLDPADDAATVGGVLACGFSGHRRLRYGHVRDLVLQTRHVDAAGKVVTAGGPTVKNVSGYDLGRLLVGSLGTLGLLAEVILRTLPVPPAAQWLEGDGDPFAAFQVLYRPSSILWNGSHTWILLEGDPADVASEASKLTSAGFGPCDGPPVIPGPGRESRTPSGLHELAGTPGGWIAEVGVGLVHRDEPVQAALVSSANAALMSQLKLRLDPDNRLNPGRRAW